MPPAFVLSQNQTLQTENVIWTEVHFYLVQKSLTCFSIVVFLTKYFASSHYFDHYDRNSFINGLIALFKFSRNTQTRKPADNSYPQLNHKRIIRWSNHCLFYMLSVQRIPSETHLRQAAEFVFSFEWSTCFILHDRLIYHTFSHCQVDFRIFSIFFQLASFARLFSEEHHVLLHYQNALLRTLQDFEIFLEEHRAFLQV